MANILRFWLGVTALTVPLCFFWVPIAFADEASDKKVPSQLDNGLISITKATPPLSRVFDYSGDFWNRSTLFGDLGGVRNELYENGFAFDAQLTQIVQDVTSGGNKVNGNGSATYNGLLELNAKFDTAKLGLWSGGLIAFTAQSSFGDPISTEAGNVSPANFTALFPKPFDNNSTELMEYYVLQTLPYDINLVTGRLDPTNFLDKNTLANDPETQFLNTSLNNNPLWGSLLSFSTYASLLTVPVTERVKIAFAGWTPDTKPGIDNGDFNDYGVIVTPIINYQVFGGKRGSFSPAFAYISRETTALDNERLAPDLVAGDPPTKEGNWLFSIVGEQYFWTPEGASVPRAKGGRKEDYAVATQDFANNPPGIGVFYRFGYMPEDRNAWNISLSGGIGARGVIPGRPHDRMGIGAYYLRASDDLDESGLDAIVDNETGIEGYYNFAITPWLQLSADLQYISPGIRDSKNAWIVGSRLFTRF